MKFALISSIMKDNAIEEQINLIEKYAIDNTSADMLIFSESFLQGFEGLTFEYLEDINRAISVNSREIKKLQKISQDNHVAISFGYIEKDDELIYSSNMVISKTGEIIDNFRRVSEGWKEKRASDKYCEGHDFQTFTYEGLKFSTAICGDLWYEKNVNLLKKKDIDILLWPLYIDFSISDWYSKYSEEYILQTKGLNYDILMVNAYVEDLNRSHGGCYIYNNGVLKDALPLGKSGILYFEY